MNKEKIKYLIEVKELHSATFEVFATSVEEARYLYQQGLADCRDTEYIETVTDDGDEFIYRDDGKDNEDEGKDLF